MASLADVFTESERTNWLKAWLAIDIAKSGLQQFVENEAKILHDNIYNAVLTSGAVPCVVCHTANLLKCPSTGICNKRGAQSLCTSMHDTPLKQPRPCPANVCNKVLVEVAKQHKFSNPSWKNTSANHWASSPWQIAMAYLPPDGYIGNLSAQDTDFNGIISFMMNCKHFESKFSFPIALGKNHPPCLLTKAREIGRRVRHSSSCKVTDADLQNIVHTLTSLLTDTTCLAQDLAAQEALSKLAKLQTDVLKLTTEEIVDLLEDAQNKLKKVENITETIDEMRIYIDNSRKDFSAHADKFKQDLSEHIGQCKQEIYIYCRKSTLELNSNYEQSCKDFLEQLIHFYQKTQSCVSVSPFWSGNDKNIWDIFIQSKLSHVKLEPDGSRIKMDVPLNKFKNLLYKGEQLHSLVFLQGESGSGKSTFLSKLVLDWCEAISPRTEEHTATFTDVETLNRFKFLFHIPLRDTKGQSEVAEIIKSLIIDRIYSDEEKRKEIYRLLHRIMERETCIITMDGLNEWRDQSNEIPLPQIATSHKQCIALITTRPWKMLDQRIKDSHIDALLEVEGITSPTELVKRLLRSFQIENLNMHIDFMTYIEERKLSHVLMSPWWLTLLLRLWMDNMYLSNSVCEVNSLLLDSLFKKANTQTGFFNPPPFECLSKTSYIEPNVNILDAISKAAFHFTCTNKRYVVFTESEIRKYLSKQDLKFSLESGILTERFCSALPCHSQFSFLHETMQEFLAAYYIAQHPKDAIEFITSKNKSKYFVLEMSQVITYLCGFKCEVANQVISCLVDNDFLNVINKGIRLYISTNRFIECQTLKDCNGGNILQTKQFGEDLVLDRCYAIYVLYQRMIIDCFSEAILSGQKDLCLECKDFIFDLLLDESDTNVFRAVLMENISNVRSLVLDNAALTIHEILHILRMSEPCLERLQTTWSDDLCNALHGMNIRQLVLQGQINVLSVSVVLPSMSKLDYLDIVQSELNQELCIPASLKTVSLRYATCSASFIHMLLVKLSSLHHSIECGFDECTADSLKEHVCIDACDMSNMTIWFAGCSYEFYELFRDTSLFDMKLLTADDVVLASGILPTLTKLQILQLWGNVFRNFDFQFPSSLRKLIIHRGDCSREWLCDLMISISSLGHPIVCQVYDLELLPSCDFNTSSSLIQASEMISILTLFDMSNIELHVKTGSSEFFEMFRDTNIPTLWLGTADAASHASQILPTLCNLQSLNLLGYFMDRCDLQLPVSLQTLIVQEGYCSPEWLCSLITALSSLGHPIICKLYGLELQSICPVNASSSQTKASEISNLISCDMSNIELFVKTGSNALFEMFRDTSLRTLWIGTAAAASHVSQILPTLCNLETLHLWGYYMDRCDLQLPVSLQTLTFQEVFCSTEWLCSLMISLSSIGHRTICKMYHLELQPSDSVNTSNMQIQPYEIISNLNSCDMSNINLHVETGSSELFELFRDTNLNRLSLGTATAASHVSQILPTLCNLEKLYLCGSYVDRCDLQMPVSLQTLIFQEVYCSTEWLNSLMKLLSSIGHRIICKLYYLEHQPSDAINISSSQLQASHLMSCDMSNIEIHVKTCSSELFEVFRDASIFFIDD